MAYADLTDVQARVPRQVWEGTPVSQPTTAAVVGWLDSWSRFVDGALAWKYVLPVAAPDADLLRQIVADLAAAQVWRVIGAYSPDTPSAAKGFQDSALLALGYDAKLRQAHIVLPHTPLAESGEADVGSPEGSFSDPDACGGEPRLFTMSQEF